MAQFLKALACSFKRPKFGSRIQKTANNSWNFSSRRSDILFWPPHVPGIHIKANHSHNKIKINKPQKKMNFNHSVYCILCREPL